MIFRIIYENSDILIIDKDAGILIYPDKYTKSGTLIDELLKYYPEIKNVGEAGRPGIVHRLDRETSGLMVCAKNQKAYEFLVEQFKARQVQKKYYALVHGRVRAASGVISFNLAKKGRKEKEPALTYYKVVEYYTLNKLRHPAAGFILNKLRHPAAGSPNLFGVFTLLDVEIKTGIMHQIRQHLKMLGHPIVGDREYTFKNLKLPYPIARHFLQAYYLKLRLPNGEMKEFKIGLAEELEGYLRKIK